MLKITYDTPTRFGTIEKNPILKIHRNYGL